MISPHIEELLPAYALGALEPAERQVVEEHLEECAYCTPLAREQLEAAATLASLAPSAIPPAHLRDRILAKARPARVSWRVGHRPRRLWSTAGYAVAASFGLLFLGVLLQATLNLQREVRTLRQQNTNLFSMINDQRTLTYVTAIPGVETMLLENTGQVPKARGMLMVSQDRTWGMLVSQGLEPLRKSMGYQVWLIKDGERISGGMFTVDEMGYGQFYIKFPSPYSELAGIGLTKEPYEGSPGPTSEPVLTGKMQ